MNFGSQTERISCPELCFDILTVHSAINRLLRKVSLSLGPSANEPEVLLLCRCETSFQYATSVVV